MKQLNFLSSLGSQSMGLRSVTLASTVGSPSVHRRSAMPKLISVLVLILTIGVGNVWGADPTVLFHETFGNNSSSARAWNDSYSVKSGESAVYSGITSYTVSNVKQGKNTTGSTQSGLNQSSQGTDAYIIIGPLNVASYSSLGVTYQWKAASTKGTYSTALYYATSSGGSYTEVSGTGTGATGFVERSYSLPAAAQVSTLYLKIVWNTSNTQAIIDEVELTGTAAAVKTLSSIAVETAPSKTSYVAGETFDPTGLVITRNYSDDTNDTYAYAGHTSDFTFSPTTSTALTTSNTSVSITYGGKSTSQAINVYNVTMQARDEDGNAIPAGGPGAPSRSGKSITPSADANNYVFKQWQVTNASLGSSESTKSNTITNPSNPVTVTAVYYKPITITYKANSQTFTTQTYGYGGTLAFPASGPNGDAYSCTGKTFTGWVAEANKDYSHATTAPTYATAGGSVTAAATYYAVFANAEVSSGGDATLTINPTSAGTTYNSNDRTIDGINMKATNNWSKQSTSGNNYVQIKTNGVVYNGTQLTGYIKSIAITQYGGTGNIYVGTSQNPTTNATSISSTTLNYTQSDNYTYFAIKSTSTLQLTSVVVTYSTSTITYSNFETDCCTPLGSINGSFFWPTFFSYLTC